MKTNKSYEAWLLKKRMKELKLFDLKTKMETWVLNHIEFGKEVEGKANFLELALNRSKLSSVATWET